jgi:hypothetical protein
MLYLIDANVLITADSTYYPIEQIPEFWDWLKYQSEQGHVKMPIEIIEEVKPGKSNVPLMNWIKINTALKLNEELDPAMVQRVVNEGYAPNLKDDELQSIGNDPFLVAHALTAKSRCIVTTEVSKPSKTRHNRHLPDVCKSLSVPCIDTFSMMRTLKFTTNWSKP